MAEVALALDPGGDRPGRGVKRILVADDERHIVRLVQVNLERYGFEVIAAFDGKEALEKICAERPDLVILDAMMPNMDGLEVVHNMKNDQGLRDIPIILLTAGESDAATFRNWQNGIDYCLAKPFNPYELIAVVRRLRR